jgi:Crinkler effector protein N-terminal domain
MSTRTLELNCLVLGENPNHIFTVKILDTEYVCDLKDEIWKKKEKDAFNDVDAKDLFLWKVSLPFGDNLQQILDEFELVKELLLQSVYKLSTVFHDLPEDEHLHILVRHPCEYPYLVPIYFDSLSLHFASLFLSCFIL